MAKDSWSPEDWAWEQIRSGRIADFNAHFGKAPDPKDPTGWGDDRKLGSGFLRRLFFEPPFRDEIPPEGVRIVGAYLPERQVLSFLPLHRQVWFEQCRFETEIDLEGATVAGLLSFRNSFLGDLNLTEAHIEGSINFGDARFSGKVTLSGAKIDSQLILRGSTCEQTVDGVDLRVGQAVVMDGAVFKGDMTFVRAKIDGPLEMSDSIFRSNVSLLGAKIGGQLGMTASTFEQEVIASGLQVGQDLFMSGAATFKGDVTLVGAKIDGQLSMIGSTFEQAVNANGLQVGKSLLMRGAARFKGNVILGHAEIDGQLSMIGSTFEQAVEATNLQVGQGLFMSGAATFKGDVTLVGAKIDGSLEMIGSTFEQAVNADSLQVGENLFMRHATFCKPMSLPFARVGANLDVRGARFAGLNLTGARIAQELRLAGDGLNLLWQGQAGDSSFFNLRNMQVGALQDEPGCWPPLIDLEGFTYGHLGGFGATARGDARDRSVADWKAWLAKDGGPNHRYSPRPYAQLASVLVAAGRRDHANAILFAGRQRERAEARREHRWRRWFWLSALRYLCGYGIGVYTFLVLVWIVGSVAAGTAVLWFLVPAAQAKGVFWCAGASLDRLLPIIQVNKEFADFFNDPYRVQLTNGVIAFFSVLSLWGWVLGSFLIAAVSGLTQRS